MADGTITSEEGTYTAGSVKYEAPITAPTATAAGREFSAWSPAVETMPAQDLTITAVWIAKFYDVHWGANGGELSTDLWTGQYGVTAGAQYGQPLTKCAFTRIGYLFQGWATSSTATEATIADEAAGVTDPTYNGRTYRLYAVWAECPHENTTTTTVDPTCTEEGSVTVTCDDCGATVSTETIEATGHDFTYTDNGDNHTVTCLNGCAYDVTEGHTFVDGSCDCGAVETVEPAEPTEVTIKISHTVSFDSDLKMNYRIKLADILAAVPNYVTEGAYLVVEKDRYPQGGGAMTVETVTLYPDLSTDAERVLFNLAGIQSVEMGSELRAVLHFFDAEGNEYYTTVDTYSVLAYAELCFDYYDPATDGYLFTMLIDCLNYGSAAQVAFDRRADEPVNAGLEAYQQYASTELSAELTDVRTYVDNDRSITAVTKMGFTVTFADKTEINAKLTIAEGYTKEDITSVKVLNETGEEVAVLTQFTELDDGRLQVTFTGMKSVDMRNMFYFVAYVGDQVASQNVGYSIEAYAKSNIASTDANAANLAKACIYYGDSAKTYFDSLIK